VRLDHTDQPEFDRWRWVDYWYPMYAVVPFKRQVYRQALRELAPLLFPDNDAMTKPPPPPRLSRPRYQRRSSSSSTGGE
jgi:putative (di)nucleoside polyphosphate hydrolase